MEATHHSLTYVEEVPIGSIVVPDGRRPVGNLDGLIGSIREIGLLNPISITPDGRLFAGRNRLEACRALGWETIPANRIPLNGLRARLAEIDENLVRNELTVLERSEQLAERKAIYEELHPEASAYSSEKQAARRASEPAETISAGFATDTASKTGVSERTVRHEVQIANAIAPDVKERIRETPLADNKTGLLSLARMEPEQQRAVVAHIATGHAESVSEAKEALFPPSPAPSHPEPPAPEPAGKMSVHFSSETPEHYTPAVVIDAVVACMGAIDLDPCADPGKQVPAGAHFTAADDGLMKAWNGRVYMNPPYGREIGTWVDKLLQEHRIGSVTEAIALVPARTDTVWFNRLTEAPALVCFVSGRLTFIGNDDPAPFPSAIVYLGDDEERFCDAFGAMGRIWQEYPGPGNAPAAWERYEE